MPLKDPDPQDPMELVRVTVPCDDAILRAKAACLAEEFLLMGHGPEAVVHLFESPQYPGAHELLQRLGADWIRDMVQRTCRVLRSGYGV